MHKFLKLIFGNEILHISDSSPVHHQEFLTVHTAMVHVIEVCWQLVSRSRCSCSQAVNKPVWHMPFLCVQWKTPDDGQMNCPRHVEFHSKNIFEKLVHLVGFIIRKVKLLMCLIKNHAMETYGGWWKCFLVVVLKTRYNILWGVRFMSQAVPRGNRWCLFAQSLFKSLCWS